MAHVVVPPLGGNPNPAIAIPNQPVTLSTLYQQMPDVYNGTYHGFLEQYSGLTATTSDELIGITKQFPTTVPNVFLYVDSLGIINSVYQIHGTEALIGQPGPWDQSCFAYNSDVIRGQVGHVLIPNQHFFQAVTDISVPTMATLEASLLALPAGTIFCGPYAVGDADTEEVSSRRSVPVPHSYVHMVLNWTFTPAEAWTQIGAQIVLDNREVDCMVLLNFLRAATTLPRPRVGQRAPQLSALALPAGLLAPVADPMLLEHQHQYLTR